MNKKIKKERVCPQYNPEICKYLNSDYCAFVRKDKKCLKNKFRGKKKKHD